MASVNLRLLSKDEQTAYHKSAETSFGDFWRTLVLTGVWALVAVVLFARVVATRDNSLLVWLLLLILVSPFLFVAMFKEGRAASRRRQSEYLESIDYSARLIAIAADDDDDYNGPNYWATGSYQPERFRAAVREAGGVSNLRDICNMYGDLDTYEANRPG